MADWIELLRTAGGIAAGGGLGWLLKSNRRKAAAEADMAEAHADNEEWQVYKDQIQQLAVTVQTQVKLIKELTEQHSAERFEMETRFNSQTDRLRDVQRCLVEANRRELALTQENGHLRLLANHFKNWHCRRDFTECDRREPEQRMKTRYMPGPGDDEEDDGGDEGGAGAPGDVMRTETQNILSS